MLRLIDGVVRARDFALIAIKDRQRDLHTESECADAIDVRIVARAGYVHFPVGFGELVLTPRGSDAHRVGLGRRFAVIS